MDKLLWKIEELTKKWTNWSTVHRYSFAISNAEWIFYYCGQASVNRWTVHLKVRFLFLLIHSNVLQRDRYVVGIEHYFVQEIGTALHSFNRLPFSDWTAFEMKEKKWIIQNVNHKAPQPRAVFLSSLFQKKTFQ